MSTPAPGSDSIAAVSPAANSRLAPILIAAGYTAVKVALCAGVLAGLYATSWTKTAFCFAFIFNANQATGPNNYSKAADLAVYIVLAGFAISFLSTPAASYFYLGAHVVNNLTFAVGLYHSAQKWYLEDSRSS